MHMYQTIRNIMNSSKIINKRNCMHIIVTTEYEQSNYEEIELGKIEIII